MIPLILKRLSYNTQEIQALYASPKTGTSGSAIPVLVAPSCGKKSILGQRSLIQTIHKLEKSGNWRFVWKIRNGISSCDQIEQENIDFILANFIVAHEEYTCLLPFMEIFDIIITDLHSSISSIATYFAPKVIVSYSNEAESSIHSKQKELIEQLTTFTESNEFEVLMSALPAPKGDPSFFHNRHGKIDGREDLRFAIDAGWPTEQV
jgi:hypothetical protein